MTRADFPTITPDIARRYITTARLSPNAVSLRIRQMLVRPVMNRVCAWCKSSLGEVDCSQDMAGKTTHGICDACAEKHFLSLQRDTPTCERPEQATCGIESGVESGARGRAATLSNLKPEDAHLSKKATERSLTACENQSGNFPAGYHINLPARR